MICVVADLLRNIRTQVLIKLITPYTRIHIPFISKELNIDACDVESLLVSCILDRWVWWLLDSICDKLMHIWSCASTTIYVFIAYMQFFFQHNTWPYWSSEPGTRAGQTVCVCSTLQCPWQVDKSAGNSAPCSCQQNGLNFVPFWSYIFCGLLRYLWNVK